MRVLLAMLALLPNPNRISSTANIPALAPATNPTTITPILPQQRRSAGCFSYPYTGRKALTLRTVASNPADREAPSVGRERNDGLFFLSFCPSQRTVTRAEPVVTALAVIPGTLQRQGAESGGEGLGTAPGQARLGAALAGQMGSVVVAMVGVELARDGLPHHLQRHPLGFGLDRLEVVEYAIADQARGFGDDLPVDFRLDRRDDFFFWAALSQPIFKISKI